MLRDALRRTPPRSAPGPSGLTGDFLKRFLHEDQEALAMLAELAPNLLHSPPRYLCRSNLVDIVKTKPDGRRKARSITCQEALMSLLERAILARWGKVMHAAAAHSAAHLKDG